MLLGLPEITTRDSVIAKEVGFYGFPLRIGVYKTELAVFFTGQL